MTAAVPTAPLLLEGVHGSIARYYTAKVRKHGATPLGVDWYSWPSQALRFIQLLKLVDFERPALSLHDLGCGYGALLAHLADRHAATDIDYWGTDLSAEMIRHARREWRGHAGARFAVAPAAEVPRCDYVVASGVFNVNPEQPLEAWEHFVAATLAQMAAGSRIGFAANFMAAPEGGCAVNPLYRVAASRWQAHCERELGCRVEIVEGYGMPEYTLLARHGDGA